jgi:chromosome partitioning protein
MLGWLKHKAGPVPGERPVERGSPNAGTDARLGRLLGRLGTDGTTPSAASGAEVHEIAPKIASPPPENETSPPTAPAGEAPAAIDSLPKADGDREYLVGVDPDDYLEALPVLRKAMAAVGGWPGDASGTLAAKIIGVLRDQHGFTPDLLAEIDPYLQQFFRDLQGRVVRLGPDGQDLVGAALADTVEPAGAPVAVATPEIAAAVEREDSATPESVAEAMPEIAAPAEGEDDAIVEPAAEVVREPAPPRRIGRRSAKEPAAPALSEVSVLPRAAQAGVTEIAGGSPRMFVIAVAAQKGGVGKTTIAAHLAVQAGLSGHGPAVLVDTDPQGSLGEWWRARNDDAPALATVKLEHLATNLAELRSYGTALAIIDTPPALTASIEQVLAVADLILIPARPSPHDLRAVGATVEMVRRAGKPFLFVVNGAAPRASITAQAVAALSEHGRVVPVILYQRTDFAASMIDGRTVIETAASGRSAHEIAELWQYVYEQIGMRVAA